MMVKCAKRTCGVDSNSNVLLVPPAFSLLYACVNKTHNTGKYHEKIKIE